ncbi:MAG: hypothetical protein AAFR52_16765 [Pseudomonadota bacterium]
MDEPRAEGFVDLQPPDRGAVPGRNHDLAPVADQDRQRADTLDLAAEMQAPALAGAEVGRVVDTRPDGRESLSVFKFPLLAPVPVVARVGCEAGRDGPRHPPKRDGRGKRG